MTKPKKIVLLVVACLFLYLSLYTWNLRTGYLDDLSSHTGLDVAGWVIRPGQWVAEQTESFWDRYIYLVGLKQENDRLSVENRRLMLENMRLHEQASAAVRLERLLDFKEPPGWTVSGAHIITHRLGPASALETVTVDKGQLDDVVPGQPAVSLEGVVGRVLKTGFSTSQVLLLTDPNSRIAVLGNVHRSLGVLVGHGEDESLEVRYVNLNAEIEPDELLVTSGMAGVFPKGLPVARVTAVRRSDISLFLTIIAEPLVDISRLEEVLLLDSQPSREDGHAAAH